MRARLSFAGGLLTALTIAVSGVGVSSTPASATVVITADNGGRMGEYASRFMQVRQSGERVVIDGICLSACTMVLGLVPRDRVCATRNAVLGFHAAWQPDGNGGRITSPPATQALMETYPPPIRSWIVRHGGLTPRMMFLRGTALQAIVPLCGGEVRVAATSTRRTAARRAVVRDDLARQEVAARQ